MRIQTLFGFLVHFYMQYLDGKYPEFPLVWKGSLTSAAKKCNKMTKKVVYEFCHLVGIEKTFNLVYDMLQISVPCSGGSSRNPLILTLQPMGKQLVDYDLNKAYLAFFSKCPKIQIDTVFQCKMTGNVEFWKENPGSCLQYVSNLQFQSGRRLNAP